MQRQTVPLTKMDQFSFGVRMSQFVDFKLKAKLFKFNDCSGKNSHQQLKHLKTVGSLVQ